MAWSYRQDASDEVYSSGSGAVAGAPVTTYGGIKLYSTDGAIDVRSHTAVLSKPVIAAAMTLAAPTADGIQINITSVSSFAHVITATGLINDGLTGVPHNTVTLLAFAGSSVTLFSYAGKWQLIARN